MNSQGFAVLALVGVCDAASAQTLNVDVFRTGTNTWSGTSTRRMWARRSASRRG